MVARFRSAPGQAQYFDMQAVLLQGVSGSGREKLVKSGLARRSAEALPQGPARRGYIRGGQPLIRVVGDFCRVTKVTPAERPPPAGGVPPSPT